jgi:hypothetical protein
MIFRRRILKCADSILLAEESSDLSARDQLCVVTELEEFYDQLTEHNLLKKRSLS